MGKDDILNEVIALKKKMGDIDAKLDRVIQRQLALEKKLEEMDKLQKSIITLPVKLNTTAYQIVSQLRSEIGDITEEFEDKVSESIGKLDELTNINKRLDIFEENMKAYIEKMKYMLLELEDSIKEMNKEGE
ncbi:MAG: hypothetical protein GXO25_02025 [Euryarchaeota archaeon]|nr:hypothetical protein [Euryarchaeota archaeon]